MTDSSTSDPSGDSLRRLERCFRDQIAAELPSQLRHAPQALVFDLTYEWLKAIKAAA